MALWMLLGAALFGPLAFGCVEPWSLAILECLIWAGVLAGLRNRGTSGWAPLHKTLLPGLMLIAALGAIQLANPMPADGPRSWIPFTASASATRRALLLWSAYAGLALSAPWVFDSHASLRRLAGVLLAAGFLVAVIGIMQKASGNQLIYGWRATGIFHHPFGPYYNRNHAATLLAASALVGIGIVFSRFAGWRRSPTAGNIADLIATQILILMPVAVIVYALLLTKSRAALHAAVLCALLGMLMGWAGGRRRLFPLRLGLAALIAAGYAVWLGRHPNYLSPLTLSLDDPANGSWAVRVSMYRSAMKMFLDSPWTGFGLGGLEAAFPSYQEGLVKLRIDHIHNDWLELLAETGIIGWLAAAASLTLWLRHVLKSLAVLESPELRQLGIWFLCALGAFSLHCAVDFSLQIPANAVVFLLILCGLTALTSPPTPPIAARRPSAALSVLCVAAAALSLRPLLGSWYHFRSSRSSLESRPQLLASAFQWDPRPQYLNLMSVTYFSLARAHPESSPVHLAQALHYSEAALRAEPLSRLYRSNFDAMLWHLRRRPQLTNPT